MYHAAERDAAERDAAGVRRPCEAGAGSSMVEVAVDMYAEKTLYESVDVSVVETKPPAPLGGNKPYDTLAVDWTILQRMTATWHGPASPWKDDDHVARACIVLEG